MPSLRGKRTIVLTVFFSGFNPGDLSEWTGSVNPGDMEVTTSGSPYEGTHHLKLLATRGSTWTYPYFTITKVLDAVYGECYFKTPSFIDPWETDLIMFIRDSQPLHRVRVRVERYSGPSQEPRFEFLYYAGGVTNTINSTIDIQADTYYKLRFYYKVHATEGEFRCWINDTLIGAVSGLDTTNGVYVLKTFGVGAETGGSTFPEHFIDKVTLSYERDP